MADRLYFNGYIESLFIRELGPEIGPALKAKLRDAGLDLDKPLLPAYPADLIPKWIDLVVSELYPAAEREEVLRRLGRKLLAGWQETLTGKATAAMMRLIGPRRSLHRVSRAYRTTDNFNEVVAVDVGPGCVELTFKDVQGMPSLHRGIMEAGAEMTGAKDYRFTVIETDGTRCVMRAEWKE